MQHRVFDHGGLHRGGGKSRGHGENKETDDESGQMPAQQHGTDQANGGQRRGRPPRRLTFSSEIDDDAKTESRREPGQQAIGSDFLGRPSPQFRREREVGPRPDDVPLPPNAADRPRPDT